MTRGVPRQSRCAAWASAALCAAVAFLAAAAPPEVVTIRVPAARTSTWFPVGTELTVLSTSRFDALVRAARAAGERPGNGPPSRLLRALHTARWDDGLLTGHSELVVARRKDGPSRVTIEPWTPAVVAGADGRSPVAIGDDGRVTLRLDDEPSQGAAPSVVGVDWQLSARQGARGWRLQLGLPAAEVSELRLDLPEGWEPQGPGLRSGPRPGAAKGRANWTFHGLGGEQEFRLSRPDARADEPDGASLWVSGPTHIEVGDATASWTTDWAVAGGPWAPATLELELDPHLELIDVTGPLVEEFRVEAASPKGPPADRPTRVTVRLRPRAAAVSTPAAAPGAGEAAGPGSAPPAGITVRALAGVPQEGPWPVPAARPLNAVWTGGTTTIKVSPAHVVRDVRPRAGRRAIARAPAAGDDRLLIFDAERPATVAEIELEAPHPDTSVDVSGRLDVGPGAPRLECRLVWRVDRGKLHDLDFDLPAAWSADRVELEGVEGPLLWHPEIQSGGGVRVRVPFPTGDWGSRAVALRVAATADIAGGRGPLALPRVRPVSGLVSDEVWVARTEPGISLQPRDVSGLAWIDPAVIPELPDPSTTRPAAAAEPWRPSLAWRWLTEPARANVERERTEPGTVASVQTTAVVSPDRVRLEARVEVDVRDQPIRSIVVGLSARQPAPEGWHFFDPSGGPELTRTELDAARRTAEGLRGSGPAWKVDLNGPQRGKVVVVARHEARWNGRGDLPLLVLPGRLRWNALAVVLTGRSVLSKATPRGVRQLDPDVTAESLATDVPLVAAGEAPRPTGAELRRSHAFAYDTPDARVALAVAALTPASTDGVIRDASLTTVVTPGLPTRHRLTLRVLPDRAPSLAVSLPSGTSLERVLRDGVPVTLTSSGDAFLVPLGTGGGAALSRGQVTVEIEYRGAIAGDSSHGRLRLERPGLSLPCLALEWDVETPSNWRVTGLGPALTPADPDADAASSFLDGWVNLARALRRRLLGRSTTAAETALREIPARVGTDRAGELSLGDWLLKWDAGPCPVVIDRAAIATRGWGPRSRVASPRVTGEGPALASAWLAPLGLSATPVGPVILVTTDAVARSIPAESSVEYAAWTAALRSAAASGGDRSDRFQSVSRWQGEPTPRPSAGESGAASPGVGEGRRVHRFVANGWPTVGVELALENERRSDVGGWLAALCVVCVGSLFSARSRTERIALTAGLASFGLVGSLFAPPPFSGPSAGLAGGALALACLRLGRFLPRPRPQSRAEGRRSSERLPVTRPASGSGVAVALALAVASLGTSFVFGQAGGAGATPIFALLPYDGPPDPTRPPDRVVLRLSDYQALRALAERPPEPANTAPRATSAVHRISWRDRTSLVVESELTIETDPAAPAGEPFAWSFPVSGTRDITASLDGAPVPVRIEDGGTRATVNAERAKPEGPSDRRHRLTLSRVASAVVGDGSARATVELNPVATATVDVAPPPSGTPAELPGARGRLAPGARPGSVKGLLGPVSRLELRWRDPSLPPPLRVAGAVEVLTLWDALPAGDRVRSRFTYRAPGGTSLVRIAVDPGVVVREVSIPGTAEVSWEGTPEHPEWVATMSPPLPDGATLGIDLWRPRPPASAAQPADGQRTLPRAEPLGVERYGGTLAVRRLPDWVGRLTQSAGSEAVSDEAFVRAWKALPDEPLTLSGAVRFVASPGRGALPTLAVAPPSSAYQVRTDAQVDVGAGRIDLTADVTLTEVEGPVFEALATGPAGFVPFSVTGEGLTDWSTGGDRQIRLRFDGAPARSRKLSIRGWVPAPSGPGSDGGNEQRVDAPALAWPGQQELPGTLVVSGPPGTTLEGSGPGVPVAAEPASAAPTARTRGRLRYLVERPGSPCKLRWKSEPLRVAVLVESQLRLDPESCDWTAVLRYDVWGGPLDVIHLKVPAEWSRDLRVRLPGTGHQQVTETYTDHTRIALRPDRPVWGSQRVVLRSERPFGPGETLVFPEVAPLGLGGQVDSYLRIVNATREAPAVEGSPGLQPVAAESVPADEELADAGLFAASATSYHVVRGGWTLRVIKPGGRAGESPSAASQPRVSSARIECTLTPEGRVQGVGRYEVAGGLGPFLEVGLPTAARPLWATVNGTPSVPLRTAAGRWEVALADLGPSRVEFLWQAEAPPGGGTGAQALELPRVAGGFVPAVVTVHTPQGAVVQAPTARLRSAAPESARLEEAAWLKDRVTESLDGYDRAARKSAEDLVAALVRFGLRLRQAARAAEFDTSSGSTDRARRLTTVQTESTRLRGELDEALRNAGLDDAAASADLWLRVAAEGPESAVAPTPDPATSLRLRSVGRLHTFVGELPNEPGSAPVLVASLPTPPSGGILRALLAALFAAFVTGAAAFVARYARASVALARLALAGVVLASAVAGGPAGLAAAAVLAVVGRLAFWSG